MPTSTWWESLKTLTAFSERMRKNGQWVEMEESDRKLLALVRAVADDERTVGDYCVRLATSLNLLHKFAEAEPYALEGLVRRTRGYPPGSWQLASARSVLGQSLAGGGKAAEAEPILLDAFSELSSKRSEIPEVYRARIEETASCLARLYGDLDIIEKGIKLRRQSGAQSATNRCL